jgi:hypothetical protein
MEVNTYCPVESIIRRVDLNLWFSRRKDVGNVVKMGIIKRIVIQRKQNALLDLTISSRLRER